LTLLDSVRGLSPAFCLGLAGRQHHSASNHHHPHQWRQSQEVVVGCGTDPVSVRTSHAREANEGMRRSVFFNDDVQNCTGCTGFPDRARSGQAQASPWPYPLKRKQRAALGLSGRQHIRSGERGKRHTTHKSGPAHSQQNNKNQTHRSVRTGKQDQPTVGRQKQTQTQVKAWTTDHSGHLGLVLNTT
jgi:hypothetical protein